MENKNRNRLFALITFLILFFFGFLISEIVIRLKWDGIPKTDYNDHGSPYYRKDENPGLSYTLRPNLRIKTLKYRLNNQGFRIPHNISREKPADVYRVALIGDSIIHGVSTLERLTISSILEDGLNTLKLPDGKRAEVLNFGVPGYNIDQYSILLDEYVADYKPDLIVVGITFHNDINGYYTRYYNDQMLTLEPCWEVNGVSYSLKPPSGILWNSYLYRYFYYRTKYRELYDTRNGKNLPKHKDFAIPEMLAASCDPEDDIWPHLSGIIDKIKNKAVEANADLLFLYFPSMEQVIFENIPQTPQKIMTNLLSEKGIEFIDLYEHFQSAFDASYQPPFRDKVSHPSNDMNLLAASLIRDRLRVKKNIQFSHVPDAVIEFNGKDETEFLSFGWGITQRDNRNEKFRLVFNDTARLVFPKLKKEYNKISIEVSKYEDCVNQKLTLKLNDHILGTAEVVSVSKFDVLTFESSGGLKIDNTNRLDLKFQCAKPVQLRDDPKVFTPVLRPASVKSIRFH